jgi:hypothetical protein
MSNYAIAVPLIIILPKYSLNGICAMQADIASTKKDYKK